MTVIADARNAGGDDREVDVDLEQGTVRVRHGKGDRSRTVGLDQQTAALLARWLDRRRELRGDLGHSSLAVSDRYLRDVAPQAVIDALRARRWDGA